MRITIVTPHLPYPDVPHGGGQDLYHLLLVLSRRHEVRIVSYVDAEQAMHVPEIRPLVADMRLIWPAVQWKQKAQRALAAAWEGTIWQLGRQAELATRQAIAGWPADVVHCAWTEMGRYLLNLPPGLVKVLDEVDVRFLVDMARNEATPRVARRKQAELAYCAAADLVLTRSAHDLAALKAELPGLRGQVLPPVAHIGEFVGLPAEASQPGQVLFVGNMSRERNLSAARWLVDCVWPVVRAAQPEATLRIVGAGAGPAAQALGATPGVTVTGWVDNLAAEYAAARVVVAPLLAAAGALNKVLDGLAAGRPVVLTPPANAGVAAPENAVALADDPATFAAAIIRLLTDETEWRRLAVVGRAFVLDAFNWAEAVTEYEQALTQMVRARQLT